MGTVLASYPSGLAHNLIRTCPLPASGDDSRNRRTGPARSVAFGHARRMDEVRRDVDGELCGFVEWRDDCWVALVVFGVELGRHDSREHAVDHVRSDGLDALSDRWMLHGIDAADAQVVCILETSPTEVTVALDYYSIPVVTTITITAAELADWKWVLHG